LVAHANFDAEDAWIKDEKAKITPLAHVHHRLQLGEDGPCHVDGQSNFTYSASHRDGRVWGIHWFVNESGAYGLSGRLWFRIRTLTGERALD